jgi:NAD kinase
MAHCGYEATATEATIRHPLAALTIAWRGIKTRGDMAPEIDMSNQRPAQYVFDGQVQQKLSEIRTAEAREKATKAAAKASASAA